MNLWRCRYVLRGLARILKLGVQDSLFGKSRSLTSNNCSPILDNVELCRLEELLVAIEFNLHILYNTDMYNSFGLHVFGTSGNSAERYIISGNIGSRVGLVENSFFWLKCQKKSKVMYFISIAWCIKITTFQSYV